METLGLISCLQNSATATALTPARKRLDDLYRSKGGPLAGWLREEAQRRGDNEEALSRQFGLTRIGLMQYLNGHRDVSRWSQELFDAASSYLGVPTAVIKILAGNIRMSDFLFRHQSPEQVVNRVIDALVDDPQLADVLPHDLRSLPFEAKQVIALLYAEVSSGDLQQVRQLPEVVYWLQRAAMHVDEASARAA